LFATGGSWLTVLKQETCIISTKKSKPNNLLRRKNSEKGNKKIVFKFASFQNATQEMSSIDFKMKNTNNYFIQ